MYALTMAGGTMFAFPDVCLTQAGPATVPVPYPNIGTGLMANPLTTAFLVFTSFMPTLNLGTMITLSSGDEAGTLGGVVSHMIIGPVNFTMGSVTTKIGGKPAVKLTSTTTQNNMNAIGSAIAPSQTSVMVLS